MKYLCLVYFEPHVLSSLTPQEQRTLDRDSLAYNDDLQRRGLLLSTQALQSPSQAVTVRVRQGRLSATDGPFAETKEQLAGFVLIDAASMDEAVQAAAGIPLAKLGSIEVRPIYDIPVHPPEGTG
jgi:hypothetical protein